MNRLISVLLAVALTAGLSACNTIKGMGQDIKKAGETIEGAAKK